MKIRGYAFTLVVAAVHTQSANGGPPDTVWSRNLRGQEVWGVAFSPDTSLVAITGFFASPRAYDARTGDPRGTFGSSAPYTTYDVVFTGDSAMAGITYAEDFEPMLRWFWVADRGVAGEIEEADMKPFAARGAAVSPDGSRVALALRSIYSTFPDRLAVYDIATGARVFSVETGSPTVLRDVAWSHDGRFLASTGRATTVHTAEGVLVATVREASSTVAWGLGDAWVAWAGDGVGIADPATGEVIRRLGDGDWLGVRASPDGGLLMASPVRYMHGRIIFWETRGWKTVADYDLGTQDTLFDAAFSSRGDLYALGTGPGQILVARTPRECPADCDRSGAVDAADFVCFQAAWRARDAYADFDGSGRWDVNDFIAFYRAALAPCP